MESYQNQHKASDFAIEMDKGLKRKRRASLQDFADKIKLGHENYSPYVPASVQGAPQNEEVSSNLASVVAWIAACIKVASSISFALPSNAHVPSH